MSWNGSKDSGKYVCDEFSSKDNIITIKLDMSSGKMCLKYNG